MEDMSVHDLNVVSHILRLHSRGTGSELLRYCGRYLLATTSQWPNDSPSKVGHLPAHRY
jgi:hypothetical protein